MDKRKSIKEKKVILVTGATGFIGWNVCKYYKNKGWSVYGISNDGGRVPAGVRLIKVDLTKYQKLSLKIKKIRPSIVIHLAAYVVLDRNFETAQKCIDANIKGTLNLLETFKKYPVKKFLFFSTEEVYGTNKIPYKENQLLFPPSPYSVSKVAGENLCLMYYKLYKLPVIMMRISTIFGYHQSKNKFIPNIILKAVKNDPILLNSGENKRDYLFIDSLLDAINKAVLSNRSVGEIFNIGNKETISGKELVRRIINLSKSKSKIILNAFPDREGEAKEWSMNVEKAKNLLNWKNKISMDEGLLRTIHFYKK